ncbi:NUDIX domain-containing protein [Streptomyces sp. CSDS2]|uniref:NUDIX hydrolase n=1 Tax=Streptomyces sp. CSDS2 TaxID=3055051 RepID=UPI0025B24ECD|nr:NUDIX domain-containing protein [Streptomyces sp. CSDS2]MDN3260197.1 NUDIX domain-containing protein [Streptomyces sp. CSDS2]
MSAERAEGVVRAVVVHDGRLLLVPERGGWGLPSGTPQPAETPQATAARVVYELTGYLVDGTGALDPGDTDGGTAVLCRLLTDSPSDGGRLTPDHLRWSSAEETDGIPLPPPVRHYLQGHTPPI